MFEALPARPSAVEACADAIRSAILDGTLPAGERLPPERRLAEQFGVNRVTVRSALARLAEQRLLSVRQGSGYVVRDYRRTGGPELLAGLAALARAGDAVAMASDLLLVRRQIARAVLEKLRPEAAGALRAAVDRLEDVVRSGASAEDVAEADVDVLSSVVGATGSPVLALCMNPVVTVLSTWPALRDAVYADGSASVAGWRGLLAWLEAGAPQERVDDLVAGLAARDELTLARMRA